MKNIVLILTTILVLFACKNSSEKTTAELTKIEENTEISTDTMEHTFNVIPISHATMILEWDGLTIYVDPVGGATAFASQPKPDLILITDIHGDHLDIETLKALNTNNINLVAPKAVADKLPEPLKDRVVILNNGDKKDQLGFEIEAIPMYNLREEALKFHEKGRGNGYVIENDGLRVYISGDTEDIPEMRNLKNIDVAFVCMNLPYTMTVKSAASAVVDFRPKKVYPYHYRGTEGFSDVGLFRDWIKKSSAWKDIEVVQLNWYPKK